MRDDRKQPGSISTTNLDREQRRRAVRNILLAGGSAVAATQPVSRQWAKPVIDVVTLPTHAGTSQPGFSISDPVSLSYRCDGPNEENVYIDITGFINIPLAGVRVRLVLSWTATFAPTMNDSPRQLDDVFTQADGSYSSLGNNIGYGGVNMASVVASLPDYPEAGTEEFSIPISYNNSHPYYCLVED